MKMIFKKILFASTITVMVFSVFTSVYALDDYTVLAPLPGTTKDNCAKPPCTDLKTYLPGLINWSMGVAAVMAFVVITIGGITYMTSDAITGKAQGRESLERAVWGLLLVIGAWVILNTINPQILNFNLDVKRLNIASTTPQVTTGFAADCPTCTGFTGTGITITSTGKTVVPALRNKLINFNNIMGRIGWRITEAFPPSVNHRSQCHYNGTCIDANVISPTIENLNKFFETAQANGLRAEYEVKTSEERTSLVQEGVTGTIKVVPWITAPHFSVYNF